jgi:putative transposase
MPFVCGQEQRRLLALPRGQSDLIYRDGSFYLHVTVEAPEAAAALPTDLLGVDLGIANIAFDSDGNRHSGTHVNKVRHRHHALRGLCQLTRLYPSASPRSLAVGT